METINQNSATETMLTPITIEQTKEKRNPSKSYTIKSLGANIKKLKEFYYLDAEEEKLITKIYEKIKRKYMEEQF